MGKNPGKVLARLQRLVGKAERFSINLVYAFTCNISVEGKHRGFVSEIQTTCPQTAHPHIVHPQDCSSLDYLYTTPIYFLLTCNIHT